MMLENDEDNLDNSEPYEYFVWLLNIGFYAISQHVDELFNLIEIMRPLS